MVAENTWKLIQMPSQGGFIWRITRRRVVKDWLILARRSGAAGEPLSPQPETEAREQKRLLAGLAGIGGEPSASEPETDAQELTDEEIRSFEAASGIGDQAPPGYMWGNPDELAAAGERLVQGNSTEGGAMEFEHATHEAAYEQVAEWLRQLYGESATPWDDSPAFSLPTGVAVAVQAMGDDGVCIDIFAFPLADRTDLPDAIFPRMLALNAEYRFGDFNVQPSGTVLFEHYLDFEGLDKEQLALMQSLVAGGSEEAAETLRKEFAL